MTTTAIGQSPDDLSALEKRLAQLTDFRNAAREELAEQGGIDPELQMEIKKLDEAIRNVNLLIFQARGNKIKRRGAVRERCPTCKRFLPADFEKPGGE
jgi:DNA repair exonuclease SbcCD ATPase subunit